MLGLNPLASAPLGDVGGKDIALSGSSVNTGAPSVEEAVLIQDGLFAGASVLTQNPDVDTTAITQVHSLSGTYTGNAASVPSGTMFEDESFSAPNVITGTVRVGTTNLTEVQVFAAPDVTLGSPVIATTNITENNSLGLSDIDFGTPSIDSTAISQSHGFASADIDFGTPTLSSILPQVTFTVTIVGGNPSDHPYYNVGSTNKFAINGSTATADVALELIEGHTYKFDQADSSNNNHPLRFSTTANGTHASGTEYTSGVTVVGTAGQSGAYTQIIVPVGAPTLYYYCSNHSNMGWSATTASNTSIAISQVHELGLSNLVTGNISLPNAVLAQVHDLGSTDVTAQSVTIDNTNLDENHSFSIADITFGNPSVSVTSITQIHNVASSDISSGNVDIASTAITQIHNINTDNAEAQNVDVVSGVITQVHDLTTNNVISGAISVPQGAFTQNHPFGLTDITFGNVEIETTTCIFSFDFAASDINYGAPEVGSTSISQIHNISLVYTGQPADVPNLTVFEDETFSAPDAFTGTVRIADAVLIQDHLFASDNVEAQQPIVSSSQINQNHFITTVPDDDVITDAPTVDNTIYGVEFLREANGVTHDINTQTPTVDQTVISQIHNISASFVHSGVSVSTTAITQLHFLAGDDVISQNVEVQNTKNPWDITTDTDDDNYNEIVPPSEIWSSGIVAPSPIFTDTPTIIPFNIHTEPTSTKTDSFQSITNDISTYKHTKGRFYFSHEIISGTGNQFFRADLQLDNMTIGNTYFSMQVTNGWQTSIEHFDNFTDVTNWVDIPQSNGSVSGRWNRRSGSTPSNNTGISTSGSAYYFYTEATSTRYGYKFWLRSPIIELNDNPVLTYLLGRKGSAIGEFKIIYGREQVLFAEETLNTSTWTDAA